jgi:hypothetical protein
MIATQFTPSPFPAVPSTKSFQPTRKSSTYLKIMDSNPSSNVSTMKLLAYSRITCTAKVLISNSPQQESIVAI